MQETQVWSLGQEGPLEMGMATHSSILTWEIPWTENPVALQSVGSQRAGHDWVTEHACLQITSNTWYKCKSYIVISSVQSSSVAQSCLIRCNPMNCSMPGLPVHHHLPEFTKTPVHRVGDAIQLSHPLSSPSPPAPNPSQHQSLFQWVNSSHEVAKVLEFLL